MSLVVPSRLAAQAPPTPVGGRVSQALSGTPTVELDGATLTVHAEGSLPRRFALGCEPVAHRVDAAPGADHGGVYWLHVACAQHVYRIEISAAGAVIVEELGFAQAVVGSHESATDTWLELADGSARSIRDLRPADLAQRTQGGTAGDATALGPVPPAPGSAATEAAGLRSTTEGARPAGSVIEVRPAQRTFVIDVGSEEGVHEGAPVAVSARELTLDSDRVVVGRVRSTTAHSALVTLPYNARVEVGQRAELADRRSRSSRPHLGEWPYHAALRLNLRPALVLENVGTTLALDAEGLVHVGVATFALRVSSTGFASGRRDPDYGGSWSYRDADSGADFGFGGGYILGGADLGFVSVALGVGVSTVYRGSDGDIAGGMERVVTVPLRLRLGTEDGAHGEVTQLIGYQRSELRWLGVEVRGQLPVGPIWLFVDGAGGRLPVFHGVIGARIPLRGNGEPGSWSLRVGAGAAGTVANSPAQTVRVGPAVQVGLDARL